MAGYTEAQKRATKKYNEKAYDDIKVRVPKGKREEYKEYAESKGTSLNKMIVDLIEREIR